MKKQKHKKHNRNYKRKFRWCWDWLILGFILENLCILIIGLDGQINNENWGGIILVPLVMWGLQISQRNLTR